MSPSLLTNGHGTKRQSSLSGHKKTTSGFEQDLDILDSMKEVSSPLKKYTSDSYLKPVLHVFNNLVLEPPDDDTQLTPTIREGFF